MSAAKTILKGKIAALEELQKRGQLSDTEQRELMTAKDKLRSMSIQAASGPYRHAGSGEVRTERTEEDERFTSFLRGKSSQPEYRAALDGNSMSTAPNSAGVAAGATGYDAGYLIPQGFYQNLQVALKQFGGLSNYFRNLTTPTGSPTPWPTTDPTGIIGSYITELNQLGFGGDSAGTDYQFGL